LAGRPRKATRQKLIEGTYRHDRDDGKIDAEFPVITATAIKAPATITDKAARAHFETLVKNLLSVQSLTEQDLAALEQAFLALEQANELYKQLKKLIKAGLIGDKDTYGPVHRQWRGSIETYSSIVYRFGVSPVERTKITKKGVLNNGEKNLADLLKRAK
jgi:phage terminase small subunit